MVKNRRFYVVFVAILLMGMLLGSAVSNAGEPEPEYITHRVRYGETLSWIAWRYGVTIQQIVDANNIVNRHWIFAGQTLRIPVERQDFSEYTVQRGDTLTGIAHRFGTTVWEVARLNGIWNVNLIFVGQRLLIPDGVESPSDNDVLPPDENGEPPSDENGEPPSDENGEPPSDENGEPPSDENGEPPPDENGEPPSDENGEPPSDENGEPPSDENGLVFEREAIVITSPSMNDTISSPVTVTGFGSGFENNLAVDVLDETGSVIGQGYVMIDAEIGQYGPFTGTIEFTPPTTAQLGRVSVYEISPRDGAIQHLNSVTVDIQP